MPKVKNWPQLFFAIFLCEGAGVLGSIFTFSSIPTWYATLDKPVFSPPNWVFGPVWTILYLLMGISLYLVWQKKKVPAVFWVQLALNALWSVIFFGLKNPVLAMLDIAVLWVAIYLTIKSFYSISKIAAYLLLPYLIWVTFASILNLSIVILNP